MTEPMSKLEFINSFNMFLNAMEFRMPKLL